MCVCTHLLYLFICWDIFSLFSCHPGCCTVSGRCEIDALVFEIPKLRLLVVLMDFLFFIFFTFWPLRVGERQGSIFGPFLFILPQFLIISCKSTDFLYSQLVFYSDIQTASLRSIAGWLTSLESRTPDFLPHLLYSWSVNGNSIFDAAEPCTLGLLNSSHSLPHLQLIFLQIIVSLPLKHT